MDRGIVIGNRIAADRGFSMNGAVETQDLLRWLRLPQKVDQYREIWQNTARRKTMKKLEFSEQNRSILKQAEATGKRGCRLRLVQPDYKWKSNSV